MAGVESETSVIDTSSIDPNSTGKYGKNYDGAAMDSIYSYGLYYTTKEIVLLGGGDEKAGFKKIAKSIVAEIELDEEIDPLRPYDDDIKELLENASKH